MISGGREVIPVTLSWRRMLSYMICFYMITASVMKELNRLSIWGEIWRWSLISSVFAQIYKPIYEWTIPCDTSLHSWLKSSSRIISCNNFFGVFLTILETVLNKVDHSSLWKQMTMEAFKLMIVWSGSFVIHLKMNTNDFKWALPQNFESFFCKTIFFNQLFCESFHLRLMSLETQSPNGGSISRSADFEMKIHKKGGNSKSFPPANYMFKVITIKTLWILNIVNFEHISHLGLVFLLLILSR